MRLSSPCATGHIGQQLDAIMPVRAVRCDILCFLPSNVYLIQVLLGMSCAVMTWVALVRNRLASVPLQLSMDSGLVDAA